MLRFHLPLIEPDVRISRIRLSDKDSRFRPRKAGVAAGQTDQSQLVVQVARRGNACIPDALHLVLPTQPLTEPIASVAIHRPIGVADRTQAEVVRPAHQHPVELAHSVLAAS